MQLNAPPHAGGYGGVGSQDRHAKFTQYSYQLKIIYSVNNLQQNSVNKSKYMVRQKANPYCFSRCFKVWQTGSHLPVEADDHFDDHRVSRDDVCHWPRHAATHTRQHSINADNNQHTWRHQATINKITLYMYYNTCGATRWISIKQLCTCITKQCKIAACIFISTLNFYQSFLVSRCKENLSRRL